MNQQAINETDWKNASNWTGPQWLSVYFSKRDSRVWVPKQIPALGWTLNLGQRAGVFWMTAFVIGLPLSVLAIIAFAANGR
jgi:uncharacterized membrane protein